MKKTFPGVNIQWPISELILSGEKTVETRTYPLPIKYLNHPILLVETPGPKGRFKSRIKALIVFTDCFKYRSKKEFRSDVKRTRVQKGSKWDWKDKPKWGWSIKIVEIFEQEQIVNKRTGIKFTKEIQLNF